MAGESYLELRDFSTGSRIDIITGALGADSNARNGFTRLKTIKQVNAPGILEVDLPGDHPRAATLSDKTQVIHWRRDAARNIDWYREGAYLFRDGEYRRQGGARAWTLRCPGQMSLLGWYHILWPAGVANRTKFTSAKAETIIKTLTSYNAVSATATVANGRDRQGASYGVSVAADAAGGSTLDWTAGRARTLLEELQALALVAGGDFDLVYVSSTSRELRFYSGQRGTDKSASIVFAENLGNLDNIRFTRTRSTERTAAIIGGKGEESTRSTSSRTGTNYDATTNNIETFVDAKDLNPDTAAAREARGDKRLDELESRDSFSFDVVQIDGSYYGPSGTGSYTLGDLVGVVRPDGVTVSQQIYRVTSEWKPGELEQLQIEVRTR